MKRWIHSSNDNFYDEYIYQGKKYYVSSGYHNTRRTDDPKQAIEWWYKMQERSPLDCAISTQTRENAIELVKAGTPEFLEELDRKHECPYRLDYMIEECMKKVNDGCKYFIEGEFGDTVHPFGVG